MVRLGLDTEWGRNYVQEQIGKSIPSFLWTKMKDITLTSALLEMLDKESPRLRGTREYYVLQELIYNEIGRVMNNYMESTPAERFAIIWFTPFLKFYRFGIYKLCELLTKGSAPAALLLALGQVARSLKDDRMEKMINSLRAVKGEAEAYDYAEGLRPLDWSRIITLEQLSWWQRNFSLPTALKGENIYTIPIQQLYPFLFLSTNPVTLLSPHWRMFMQIC